jgi:hypothetical protein
MHVFDTSKWVVMYLFEGQAAHSSHWFRMLFKHRMFEIFVCLKAYVKSFFYLVQMERMLSSVDVNQCWWVPRR